LIEVGLRDDSFEEEQSGEALVRIGGGRGTCEFRDFLGSENSFGLEKAGERANCGGGLRLLLSNRSNQADWRRKNKKRKNENRARTLREHAGYPLVTGASAQANEFGEKGETPPLI
jgi:hypothetical protein